MMYVYRYDQRVLHDRGLTCILVNVLVPSYQSYDHHIILIPNRYPWFSINVVLCLLVQNVHDHYAYIFGKIARRFEICTHNGHVHFVLDFQKTQNNVNRRTLFGDERVPDHGGR